MKNILLSLLFLSSSIFAETWISSDGKIIQADFIKVENKNLHIEMNGKVFQIPLDRLSKESSDLAIELQDDMLKKAIQYAYYPIVTEKEFLHAISQSPESVENMNYLIEGEVSSIRKHGGLNTNDLNKADITFRDNTKITIDFSTRYNTKIQITNDHVAKMKRRYSSSSVNRAYTLGDILVERGQNIIFHITVKDGEVKGLGIPSSTEITRAKLELAQFKGAIAAGSNIRKKCIVKKTAYLKRILNINENPDTPNIYLSSSMSQIRRNSLLKELEILMIRLAKIK